MRASQQILFSKYYKANVIGVDFVLKPLKVLMNYLSRDPHTRSLQIFVCGGDVTELPFRDGFLMLLLPSVLWNTLENTRRLLLS